jgi:hypothetical protein
LRRGFNRYNELANAVLRALDVAMPEIDLSSYPQDFRHARTGFEQGDAARCEMAVIGIAIALGREFRIELGCGLATAHGLHIDDQIDQIVDRRLMRRQPNRMRASERQPQCELGFRQPAIELMPEQPAGDRLWRLIPAAPLAPRRPVSPDTPASKA